jgi:uncharacterized membrane protein
VLLLLLACATAEDPECEGAPVVTYANFGQGFLKERCAGCHAATAPDRYGAPEELTFDTVDEAWAHAPDILDAAAPDDARMPLGAPAPADDRTMLRWWLACAEEGT